MSIEHIEALYLLELHCQGIYEASTGVPDDVEVTYGAKITDPDNMDDPDLSR